jgi:DNA-binding beta-propeller fold protein YncE
LNGRLAADTPPAAIVSLFNFIAMKNLQRSLHVIFAILSFLLLSVATLTECSAQATPKRSLLALSKANHSMAIVDPVTLQVIARIPVGEDPHELTADADGRRAYVCIYGGGSLHEINVIDLVAQKPLLSIDTRPLYGPHDISFVNGKLWFTAEGSKSVGRYDPVSARLDWSMGTGQDRTHMIYVSPDAKRIYTTNMASGTVSIIVDTLLQPGPMAAPGAGPRQNWTHSIITVSKGSEGFDVSPDGSTLWTASAENGSIAVIDPLAKKLVATFDAGIKGANRLKFTPDGKRVFVSSLQSGELAVYDAQSHKSIKRLSLGHGAAGILMDPEAQRAFIACSADNYIAVIDLKSLELISRLDVGGTPDGMAWAVQH